MIIGERCSDSSNTEYVLSGSEDNNIVAYRIVHVPDDSPRNNQTIHTTSPSLNNSVTTSVPLQYIVFDGSNGFLQALPTTQITAVPSTPIKIEPQTTSNSSTVSNPLKMRTSVAIAPKIEAHYSTSYSSSSSSTTSNSTVTTKSNVRFL